MISSKFNFLSDRQNRRGNNGDWMALAPRIQWQGCSWVHST